MVWLWVGFIVLIVSLLMVDLLVLNRKAHEVHLREALLTAGVWVALGLSFTVFVFFAYDNAWFGIGHPPPGDTQTIVDELAVSDDNPQGINDGHDAAIKYLTGYVIEESLSVDNLFVIATIFAGLGIPAKFQHRVLFWGILGALILRGIMIVAGTQLVGRFEWLLYVFGGVLILTGIKMLFSGDHDAPIDPRSSRTVKLVSRFMPVTDELHGQHFFTRSGNQAALAATPLFLALIMVETADLVFAVDSIPAILAITTDPFLVFTSNAFAIIGLRSLYFALATMVKAFRFLSYALSAVLVFIGIKMLLHTPLHAWLGDWVTPIMLAVVVTLLGGGVVASLLFPRIAKQYGESGELLPNADEAGVSETPDSK